MTNRKNRLDDEIVSHITALLLCKAFERTGINIERPGTCKNWKDALMYVDIIDKWCLYYNKKDTGSTLLVQASQKELLNSENLFCVSK